MRYSYPLSSVASFVERIDELPHGAQPRRWVLRDDNQRHYVGVVRLAEDPVYIELYWKPDVRAQEQRVGQFKLHLGQLLLAGYVRLQHPDQPDVGDIRLRFHRGERGVISIQSGDDEPALPIGIVDATVG